MRILIADDDPAALLLLESVLEDWGYEVVTARTARKPGRSSVGPMRPPWPSSTG